MKYFIGVDGGSTKTIFAISEVDGKPLKTIVRGGCSYQSIGVDASIRLINDGINELLQSSNIKVEECAGCCIGMPCYGENINIDYVIVDKITKILAPLPIHVVNDVEIGWAGSLECNEGIHIAAGTGSIAFGRGSNGQCMRCGGWNEFYGDEGSCYWIGRQAMSLFSKQADGRMPRGALYDIVRKELGLVNDFYFTDVIRENWAPYRWKVAAFQTYAFRAFEQGDTSTVALYEAAAGELALMVNTIKNRLSFSSEEIFVSYSGGLFNVGDLILNPFRNEIEKLGCILKEPSYTATEGALLLAIKQFHK